MACLATNGFLVNCKSTIGGIKALWIGPYATIKGAATIDASTEMVTALPAATWVQFDLKPHSSNFKEEAQVSKENNTIFYLQTILANFHGLSAARRKEVNTFSKGRHAIIVQDNNNNYWLVGYLDGAEVSAETTDTGTAKGDANSYSITFTAEEKNKAYRLTDAIVSDFDGTITAPTLDNI
jgi:hypothetical protein